MNELDIKGFLFDFGGTIDSNGQHWASIIWELYQKTGVEIAVDDYYAAYVYGERALAKPGAVPPTFNFKQLLEAKLTAQFEFLKGKGINISEELDRAIALEGYLLAKGHVEQAEELLKKLRVKYPLVVVSNFYGNLHAVLSDFGIDHYFDAVVESAVVGVRKPDPAIYKLGVEKLGFPADQCLVVGDSYQKDMEPAKACGCYTVWLKGKVWKNEEDIADPKAADRIISDIQELALWADTTKS